MSTRAAGAGSHQFQRPIRRTIAGTSSARITVASNTMPAASPIPNCLMSVPGLVDSTKNANIRTSAALVLMFAFFVLSSSPGVDIKQFGIGLAAGIIFDATVIRTLLVPSLVRLFGRWNWWLPHPVARVLRVPPAPLRPAGAAAGGR